MTKKQTIHKAKGLESEFVILANKDVQRSDLSYEAIGMLVYLMSLPETWVVYVSQLQRKQVAGRDKVRRILKELETHGYLHIEQGHDEDGKFTTNQYDAYAMPEYNPHFTPLTENPSTDKPFTANPKLESKDIKKVKTKELSAPDESDDTNPPLEDEKPKPKKRDILFDGIVATAFRINPLEATKDQLKEISGRVGKIKKRLVNINPEFKEMSGDDIRKELKSFWTWYQNQNDFDEAKLRSDVKWAEYYLTYHLQSGKPTESKITYFKADEQEQSETDKASILEALRKGDK